jgi:hypothetical protein
MKTCVCRARAQTSIVPAHHRSADPWLRNFSETNSLRDVADLADVEDRDVRRGDAVAQREQRIGLRVLDVQHDRVGELRELEVGGGFLGERAGVLEAGAGGMIVRPGTSTIAPGGWPAR